MLQHQHHHHHRNPYAVLNLPQQQQSSVAVSDDRIRESYKRLSRLFHPDKHPPGKQREDAQELFIELYYAYETLVDPSLRQAYDHFGYNAVSLVRNNRYAPDSLYSKLSKLHQKNKSSEALDLLYIILEDKILKQRMKEWTWGANVELGMDMYMSSLEEEEEEGGLGRSNVERWPELSSTNVSLTASVPILPAHQTANVATASHTYNSSQQDSLLKTTEKNQQKVLLSIGGQSNLKSGFGSTSGILSCQYMPVPQTSINSDLAIGYNSLNTSLSSSTQLINGTDLSAKINHQYETTSEEGGGIFAYGFTSSRRLTIFSGRTVHAMFALGLTSNFIMNYGIFSFTTWGLFNTTSSMSDNQQPLPRLSTKLSIGTQYLIECSIEQKKIFNSSYRSGQASVSWSPVRGCKWNVMLSRCLPRRRILNHESDYSSKLGIGIQHTAMSGLKLIFHYQRPEGLSIRIPIFISNFISPGYWSTVIWISTVSYLFDETIEKLMTMSNTSTSLTATTNKDFGDNTPDKQISKRIRVYEYEQQWLQSSNAKCNASEQLSLIVPIAKIKRQLEEAVNGLVILKATYLSTKISNATSLDVVQQLQFWVNKSRLHLPPLSKGMLLGFYDMSGEMMMSSPHESYVHRWMRWMNKLFTRLGVRGWNSEFKDCNAVTPVTLTVRYKFGDGVYEITIDDSDELDLPSSAAVMLGSSHIVS